MLISMTMGRVRRSPRIAFRTVDGETAVVTVDDRKLHLLNEVGAHIFESLREPATLDELTDRIIVAFEVERDQARRDCEAFCQEMIRRRILEWTS